MFVFLSIYFDEKRFYKDENRFFVFFFPTAAARELCLPSGAAVHRENREIPIIPKTTNPLRHNELRAFTGRYFQYFY